MTAYQTALADVEAEATRRFNMNEHNPPVEGRVVIHTPDDIRPMTKVEAGVMVAVVGAVVTAIGFGIRADIKNQDKLAEKYRLERQERDEKAAATRKARTAWFDNTRKNGMIVLELRDGSYIAISNEAYSKAEIKKKGDWL